MVANYLQQCGVDIGGTLHPGDVGNPKGYYEDIDFLKFHQNLLSFYGLSIFPTDEAQLPREIPEKFRLRAREIVKKKGQSPVWGWKEPRTTLFLEFWQKMIPNMNVLFLLRHPVSVVDSLLRRGTDPMIMERPAIAFESWCLYNQRISQFYCNNQTSCFLVDINDFVKNPSVAVSQLFLKLRINLPVRDFDTVYVTGAFKERKTVHDVYRMLRHILQALPCLKLYRHMKQLTD